MLTELLAPGVSDGPVLSAILFTPADDGDIVDDIEIASFILKDTTLVVLELLSDSNTAGNRATLVDLLHHVFLALNLTVFLGLVDVILIGDEATLTGHAVLALDHGRALTAVVVATGSVDRAGLIGTFVLAEPLESVVSLTTVAAIVTRAGDKDLRGNVDIGPSSFAGNLDAIRKSGSGGMGPARTAVLRNVLVAHIGEEVVAVDVIPDPLLGKIVNRLKRGLDEVNLGLAGALPARLLGVDVSEVFLSGGVANEGNESSELH